MDIAAFNGNKKNLILKIIEDQKRNFKEHIKLIQTVVSNTSNLKWLLL